MTDTAGADGIIRFGVFEVDLRTEELRKQGLKIKLQGQPYQILVMLLENPGEILKREELRKRLWPADTFVDFEHGLNKAINRIREALGDTAESPRYVETLPRRGYRFVAPVARPNDPAAPLVKPELDISRGTARALFATIQVGYLVMYGVALYHLPTFVRLHFRSPVHYLALPVALYLICSTALRMYLLSAVVFDYPAAGRLFRRLFLAIVIVDLAWSASPVLLFDWLREVTLLFVAGLAFLPFSQRSLMFSAYAPSGGRISAGEPPAS
jgi:DNA-binding winged helix-turn-helix (wHTH) protein